MSLVTGHNASKNQMKFLSGFCLTRKYKSHFMQKKLVTQTLITCAAKHTAKCIKHSSLLKVLRRSVCIIFSCWHQCCCRKLPVQLREEVIKTTTTKLSGRKKKSKLSTYFSLEPILLDSDCYHGSIRSTGVGGNQQMIMIQTKPRQVAGGSCSQHCNEKALPDSSQLWNNFLDPPQAILFIAVGVVCANGSDHEIPTWCVVLVFWKTFCEPTEMLFCKNLENVFGSEKVYNIIVMIYKYFQNNYNWLDQIDSVVTQNHK